jgi:hypothetical protein
MTEKFEDIQFVDERERELFARAQLGEQTRTFLQSPIGRYLHGRCRGEVEQCQEEVLLLDPWTWLGRRKLKKVQKRYEVASCFMRFLTDALVDGDLAYDELSKHRQPE